MSKEHWAPLNAWLHVVEEPGMRYEYHYRSRFDLSAKYDSGESRWHCVSRATDFADGYREDYIEGDPGNPEPAIRRCYELADGWLETH